MTDHDIHSGPVVPERFKTDYFLYEGTPSSTLSQRNAEPSVSPDKLLQHDDSGFRGKLLDCLYDGVYFVDTHRKITYWNKGAERLTGYTAQEAVGKHCFDNFLVHMDDGGSLLCFTGCPLRLTIADGEEREAQVSLRHKEGHRVPVLVRVSPIRDEQRLITGAVEIFSDNSATRALEKRACELEALAYSDGLTGVANRRYIDLKVQQAIQEVELFDRPYGLILIDVDGFKEINDTYGHVVGDGVLKAVCETLRRTLRPTDVLGRWGGDEFLVVARDVTTDSLEHLANRCRQVLAEIAIPVKDRHVTASVSIGPALLKKGESSTNALVRADRLLYLNKRVGKNWMR
jgi:diguanylate cyclase (GGDEF)-like protein/PAS domain S-box-containing protein